MQKEIQEQVNKGMMLPLMEEFYTIQGEGYHKGTAAYFIRVGGCDVGCHWCDVKESWNPKSHPPTPIDAIANNANKYSKTIVITGGEPLTWDMGPLTSLLKKYGYEHSYRDLWSLPFVWLLGLDMFVSKKNEITHQSHIQSSS